MPFLLRLDSVLVRNGISTHRRVRRLLQTHNVLINGVQVFNGSTPVDVWHDEILIDGKTADIIPDVYFIMNKNQGTVCSTKDGDSRSVFDLIAQKDLNNPRLDPLHTVGRLDKDTTGLLILTTDGDFSHHLTEPVNHVSKTYEVTLKDPVTAQEQLSYIEQCKKGFYICAEKNESAFTCKPSKLIFLSPAVCHLTICEGKFHQVKRMFSSLHNEVIFLKRISIAELELPPELKEGEYRALTQEELVKLCPKAL